MKATATYTAALLAVLSSSVLASDFQSFGLVAHDKNQPEIYGQPKKIHPINAKDKSFYYGKSMAATYDKEKCKYPKEKMTKQTLFSYDFDVNSNPNATLALNVVKEGGHQGILHISSFYINATDGSLMFTTPPEPPKYGAPPPPPPTYEAAPILGPFNFTGMPNQASPHGRLEIPGCDVLACPEGSAFKIFAKNFTKPVVPAKYGSQCKPVDLLTVVGKGEPAYEYV